MSQRQEKTAELVETSLIDVQSDGKLLLFLSFWTTFSTEICWSFYEERGKRVKVLDSIQRVQNEGQNRKYAECQHLVPIKQHTLYQQEKEECPDVSHTQHHF